MFHRKAEYKILSFSTTMRNPYRIANFLKALLPFENHILTHEIIMRVIAALIKDKLYMPTYATRNFKDIVENDLEFNENQILEIIVNSPQNHKEAGFDKGWDSRFDTFYKLPMEFGFCLYAMNEPLIISNTGHLLIDAINEIPANEEKIEHIFLNCMMKYQCNNPFRNTLNSNVPLLLLLYTMNALKQLTGDSKIHKSEIAFFLCWKDSDYLILANFIVLFRNQYPSFQYSNEIIYEKCLEILESSNTTRFKISQVCGESIDEYIRKMRITGIISLRGNGRFLDFNTFETTKIKYILKSYNASGLNFTNKQEYFNFMGQIDSNILELKTQTLMQDTESLKQQTLNSFANRYNKEDIYKELAFLTSKKSSSKDEVFKFIPEPTRFEFLVSIALKQHFIDLEILPNYSIDDEGLPKCHASGNKPDIVCKNMDSKSIVEVSLLCGKAQVVNELIPITRHLKDIIDSTMLTHFAVFIAPMIHEDSKRYVKFIKFDENLDIRNFSILEFIENLQNAFNDFLSINQSLL